MKHQEPPSNEMNQPGNVIIRITIQPKQHPLSRTKIREHIAAIDNMPHLQKSPSFTQQMEASIYQHLLAQAAKYNDNNLQLPRAVVRQS